MVCRIVNKVGVRSSGVRSMANATLRYQEFRSSGVWLTPRFAIRSMALATLRYQESGERKLSNYH
ncbi:MAG: hypothetical protein HEQ24_01875 [Dolichospermum sp. BR01]|nr:hypothetical protein [Dolichospermum sp. BR01]